MPSRRIVVNQRHERLFRRRALRAFPREYLEVLWGRVADNVIYVDEFVPIKHKGHLHKLKYEHSDLNDQVREARKVGLQVVGTCHSHPCNEPDWERDTTPSEGDIEDVQLTKEMVMGICSINQSKGKRRLCKCHYWPCPRPIPVRYKNGE